MLNHLGCLIIDTILNSFSYFFINFPPKYQVQQHKKGNCIKIDYFSRIWSYSLKNCNKPIIFNRKQRIVFSFDQMFNLIKHYFQWCFLLFIIVNKSAHYWSQKFRKCFDFVRFLNWVIITNYLSGYKVPLKIIFLFSVLIEINLIYNKLKVTT